MKKLLFLLLFPLSFFSQTCTYPFSNIIKDIVETNDGNFVFSSGDFKTTKVDFNFDVSKPQSLVLPSIQTNVIGPRTGEELKSPFGSKAKNSIKIGKHDINKC